MIDTDNYPYCHRHSLKVSTADEFSHFVQLRYVTYE